MRLSEMRRRNRGLQVTLRSRLESCKSNYWSTEEIVNHLRSTYDDYNRTKKQRLIRLVRDALRSTNNEIDHNNDDDNIDDESQKMEEALHIRRKRRKSMGVPSTSSDSASECSGCDGAVLEGSSFDLMKTMQRNSYTGTKAVVPTAEEEKNVELEMGIISSKAATSIVNVVDGGEANSSVSNDGGGGGGDGVKVKRKKEARFKDFGGMKEILEDLKKDLMLLYHPELPRYLGVRPITGILLHGPPGCGKTRLAHAIANETGFSFHSISSTEVVSGVSGESEEKIRELFSKAKMAAPSVVFIDEIDAIASKRENLQREMEKRIVTQLITCMDEPDDSGSSDDDDGPPGYVLVIGATNRLDAIDPALRRPGRFDREIFLPIPDESAREEILFVLARSRNLKLDALIDLRKIARSTPGFVGADLEALVDMAGRQAANRTKHELSQDLMSEPAEDWWKEDWSSEERNKLAIKVSDFKEAAKLVQPSSRTKGFSLIPNVKWEDVGALDHLREELDFYIVRRIKYPEDYEGLGMDLEMGFLLYGPPGCGKTLIAKAVANAAGANFIHIKGPELLNKYVGESELSVRRLFSEARTCAPCILFFDEVDALTTERGKDGGRVIEGVLNQLLIELDGAEQRRGVFVIGATNRPEVMDRALLRPGRFGKLLYVPLPSPNDRVLILKALARKKPVDASVDLSAIGRMKACENLSGADLKGLMHEATMAFVKEKSTSTKTTRDKTIKTSHFEVALSKVSPSVSSMRRQYYQRLSESLKAA